LAISEQPEKASGGAHDMVWPPAVGDADILWLEDGPAAPASAGSPAPSTSTDGIPLTQILAADTGFEWHDAVALLRQLSSQAVGDNDSAPAGTVPDLGEIRLKKNGTLSFNLQPSGREPFIVGLGRTAVGLLSDRPCPANLKLLAWRTASNTDAGSSSVSSFLFELARWERPNRAEKLVTIYNRARAAGCTESLERLPAAPVVPPSTQETPPAESEEPPQKAWWRNRALWTSAGAIAAIAVVLASVLMWRRGIPPAVGAEAEAAASPGPSGNAAKRAKRASDVAEGDSAAARSPGRPATSGRTSGRSRPESLPNPPITPLPESAPAGESGHAPIIYEPGVLGVTEPTPLKDYLPRQPPPGVNVNTLGVLELVIGPDGSVESVHLRSPQNRYRERWWVYTAKQWRFRPATLNGHPVRFLTRIPITDVSAADPQ
jgi:hypothetical protein